MKRVGIGLAFLFGAIVPTTAPGADLGIAKLMSEVKVVREFYPAPYERLLDAYVFSEDRIVAVFRALATARADSSNSGVASFLDRALSEQHRTQCATFKRELLSARNPGERLAELLSWWNSPSRPEDRAAFAQLFRILPPESLKRLGLETLAGEAFAAETDLKAPANLARYATAVPEKQQYTNLVRRTGWWNQAGKDELDRLTAKVRFAFSSENLLRFIGRATQKASSPKTREVLQRMQQRLTADLVQEIGEEFRSLIDDQLFGSEITFIGQTSNNGLQIKESLIKGRLRLLVKRAQMLETRLDRQLFAPLLERIGGDLTSIAAGAPPKARDYAGMVNDTLKMLSLIKLRALESDQESDSSKALFRQIGRYLADQDKEKLTEGLDSIF